MNNYFKVRRFNWRTSEDVDYDYPDDWLVAVWDANYDHPCQCASCGGQLPHESAWPSSELHTVSGWPIRVCAACISDEAQRRVDAWDEKQVNPCQ